MKINQSAANYIDILKNANRKPIIGSQINLTQNDCESTLSHMPVNLPLNIVQGDV